MRLGHSLIKWIAVSFIGAGGILGAPMHDLSIELASASAYRWHLPGSVEAGYIVIDCKIVIINKLPNDITVHSGYDSAFNWVELKVTGDDGRILSDGLSVLHNAPCWPSPGKAFDIPRGRSTNEIRFWVDKTFLERADLQFYVHGVFSEPLVNTKLSCSLTSNIVRAKLKPYPC
jgi:hypothetical protein